MTFKHCPNVDGRSVLTGLGAFCTAIGFVFLAFVAAAPLGLVNAYPTPPQSAIDGPLGMSRPIPNVDVLYRHPGEPEEQYFERLTKRVAAGITHYWTVGNEWKKSDRAYTEISPWDNYLLWLQGFIPKYRNLHDYEFIRAEKALDRGYGWCSQVSRIVYDVLFHQNISAKIFENPDHVIVEANGSILDADFGVFIPHSTEWMKSHLDAVNKYYAAYPWMITALRDIYANGWKPTDVSSFSYMRRYTAKLDRLKWVPPLFMVFAGLVLLIVIRLRGRPPRATSELVVH